MATTSLDFNGSTIFETWFQGQSAWYGALTGAVSASANPGQLFGSTRLNADGVDYTGDVVTLNIRGTAKAMKKGLVSFETDAVNDDTVSVENNVRAFGGADDSFNALDVTGVITNGGAQQAEQAGQAPILATGGRGNDRLIGGQDDDVIASNTGDDFVFAEGGNDFVKAGAGNDFVYGGAGNDLIYGDYSDSARHEKLQGARANMNDQLFGGEGNDILFGNQGDDVLDGGAGNDTMIGGSGADEFIFNGGNDVIKDFGRGDDTITIDLGFGAQSFDNVGDLASAANFAFPSAGGATTFGFVDTTGGFNLLTVETETDLMFV
ncbi:hypothetical protein J7413_02550 [Shimia sp. R10_1]|uniref:calcium-binding protein n=1 Tax=Shimia sp. R10_1 TaxID=2821095 RepID=UPI001ADA0080|nr:calcium-binding protein [Shimia sp. R10_1]MBO9472406.1 hypothetical protein [Shimia sp. R10_1]